MTVDEQTLIDFITGQRWFGSKTRHVTHATLIDRAVLRETDPALELQIIETRFDTGTHETYQLLADGGLDALGDPRQVRELVHMIRGGAKLPAGEGVVEFAAVGGFAGLGSELREARQISAEQSNTSVVFDDELILKVFRRLEAGINPELELLRFLTERGFENIAQLAGWYAYTGRPMDATLGILQRFVANGRDGWEFALETLGDEAFLTSLHRLGAVTGQMHTLLGSDSNDPSFCPEQPSSESLGLLTATIDDEIEAIFVELPDTDDVEPIRGRGEEVREQLRLLTHAGSSGRVIRTHGDYHLGQTLWKGNDWTILDFEGEPARTLVERRRKRSPLRDVAGMLRSFAYAATAAELTRAADVPEDWEERARERFLESYLETVDQALLPPGEAAIERLLAVFELEKAVYELRYELDNRPDWVGIPVAGIERLMHQAAEAL
jgi:trehalose synthase-fused probable maltokinase